MNAFLVLCFALTFCYATATYGASANYRTVSRVEPTAESSGSGYGSSFVPQPQVIPRTFASSYNQPAVVQPPVTVNTVDDSSNYGQRKVSLLQDTPPIQKPTYGADYSAEPTRVSVPEQQTTYTANYAQKQPQMILRQLTVNPYATAALQRFAVQSTLPRTTYGYGFVQRPVVGYAYGTQTQMDLPVAPLQPTPEDIMCQGKEPATYIPQPDLRGVVVCIDDGKGYEIKCPKHLYWSTQVNRCEKKATQLLPPCLSNPCQNGGQCSELDIFSYKCDCPPGFDGVQCERDQRACTPSTCGGDGECRGFRIGSALSYVCLCNEGNSYGPNCQQAFQNPCLQNDEQYWPLGYSDKGFIMCNGDQFFVETCPGTTVWDQTQKTCIVPDVPILQDQNTFAKPYQSGYSSSYQAPKPMPTFQQRPVLDSYATPELERKPHHHRQQLSDYSAPQQTFIPQPKPTIVSQGYGSSFQQQDMKPKFIPTSSYSKPIQQDFPRPTSSYNQQAPIDFPKPQIEVPRPTSSYNQQPIQQDFPRPTSSYNQQPIQQDIPRPTSTYNQQPIQQDFPRPTSTYNQQPQIELPKPQILVSPPRATSSYGQQPQIEFPKPQVELPRPTSSYAQQPQRSFNPY